MNKLPEELIKNFLNDGTAKGLGDLSMMVSHIITAHSQGVEEVRRERDNEVIRLKSDIAHAIGFCQGIGHPEWYLEKQYPELCESFTNQSEEQHE